MNTTASRQQFESFRHSSAGSRDTENTAEVIEAPADEPDRSLNAFVRKQAAHLIDWTLHAELEILLAQYAAVRDPQGRPAYVRNGYQPPRELMTNVGPVRIRIPKLRSRVDRPVIFRSTLARPYLRRSRSTISKAPARFLRGLSVGDLHAAIGALMGPEAAALPGAVIRRIGERWAGEHKRWLTGSLTPLEGVSLWLDSIDGGEDPTHGTGSVMVAVAIDEAAREKILSVVHGGLETEQTWAQLLLGLRSRGMPPPHRLHLGSSGRGARAAATAMVYPETMLND